MSRLPIDLKPYWPVPSAARLRRARPKPGTIKHYEEWLDGLQEVRIHVNARKTVNGYERGGEIQRIYLKPDKDVAPEKLARVAWLRAAHDVGKHRTSTQFRVHLMGTLDGEPFDKQHRFTIKPHEILEQDRAPADADEPGDAEDGDAEDGDEEDGDAEKGEDEDEEEEEGEEGEDEDEEIDDPYDGRSDYGDEDEEDEADWTEGPKALVPLEARIEAATGERHLVPSQLNPAFITHVQKNTLNLAHRAYSAPMRENRMLVHEMRQEMSAVIRDVKGMAESLLRQSIEMHKVSADRSDKLIGYLTGRLEAADEERSENSKLNASTYKNFQEIAKQGWVAMLDGMRAKEEVANDRLAWARQREAEAMSIEPPEPVQRGPGLLTQLGELGNSPGAIAFAAQLLRRAGRNDSADYLEKLAMNLAKSGDDDEDEDDEAYDVDAHEPGNGHARDPYVGQPEGPSAPPRTPFVDRVRRFHQSLDSKKIAAMRKILPKPAWVAYEAACAAADDASAVTAIRTLKIHLEKNMVVAIQLGEQLTEDQMTEILAVVDLVGKAQPPGARPSRRAPPRPEPPSAAE